MSLLSRLRGGLPVQRAVSPVTVIQFADAGIRMTGHRLTIRGESHYLPQLARLQRRSEYWQALLVREPRNRFDSNAVAVHIEGLCVGYVAREQAEEIAPQLDALNRRGLRVGLAVNLCGGTPDKPNIGVFPDD